MSRGSPVGAWLQLLRISNAPTVVSNVLAGIAVGLHARLSDTPVPFGTTLAVLAGVVTVYMAGMVLNDAFDARIDARERPGRPIPSGRVARATAMFVGFAMLLAGIGMMAWASSGTLAWAIALGACVLAYDALHSVLPGGFLLMAACRAMVPVIAAFATSPGAEWSLLHWVAGGTFAYVAALSVAAKDEVRGFGTVARIASWLLPLAACAPLGMRFAEGVRPEGAALVTLGVGAMAVALATVVAGIRTARQGAARYSVPVAVGTWLGAIPAIDAATCFLLERPLLGLLCVGLWGMAGALRPRFASS